MTQGYAPRTKPLIPKEALANAAERATQRRDWLDRLAAARSWVAAYNSNDIQATREKSLQAAFLHRIFVDILGYVDQATGPGQWTLTAEPSTDLNAKAPDGSLGFFSSGHRSVRAVIELKDAATDLDAKQLSRRDRLSPVEQGFLYLGSFDEAQFALISNFRVMRLYSRRFGMTRYV